jgi:hypothetical protein
MTPSELRASRDEYKAFDKDVFRNHIYQEADSRPKRAWRFAKKNKNKSQAQMNLERQAVYSVHQLN